MVDNIPMKNVCRICLLENVQTKSIFSLEKLENSELQISDIIMACASVQITMGDGLPSEICVDCNKEVKIVSTFKQKCEKSDALLRKRFELNKLFLPKNECFSGSEIHEEIDIKPDIYSYSSHLDVSDSDSEDMRHSNEIDPLTTKNDTKFKLDTNIPLKSGGDLSRVSKCPICEKSMATKYMNKHLKNHTNSKEYECERCYKGFARKESLIRHDSVHAIDLTCKKDKVKKSGSKKIKKQTQGSKKKGINDDDPFFKSANLNTVKDQDQVFACNQCDKTFSKEKFLTQHANRHSNVAKYVCDVCTKAFKQLSNLKSHLRTHNKEKPFLCSVCGKGFTQVGHLQEHMLRHTGIKAHVCSVCNIAFVTKGELASHSRIHSEIRPYICDVCGADFLRPDSLTKHKEGIHLGKRPYECDVCKATFSRSHHLVRHKHTHSETKPYSCEFCTKKFTQNRYLVEHTRIHTGERPYVCNGCGKGFTQGSSLKTHKKSCLKS